MDMSNWRPMECGDWRSQLEAASRQKIVNTITNTLKRHTNLSGPEVQYVIEKTAAGFEELIYTTAISQVDYLQKISMKMQKFDIRSQNPISTGSHVTQQVNSQGQPLPIPVPYNHPQQGQQLLPHVMHNNIINSTGVQVGMESGDWRARLQTGLRQKIVNMMTGILKRHAPFSGHEMLQELEKLAVKLEQKIFTAAISESDYMLKFTSKMSMQMRSQHPMPIENSSTNSVNLSDSGSQVMQLFSHFMHSIASTGMQAIGDTPMESSDWRGQLQADSRHWIVSNIMETLKRLLPLFGDEMVDELEKTAVRFEDKIYTSATSQSDYMRKIFLKMPTMETGPQNSVPYAMQTNSGANSVNPSNPVIAGSSTEYGDWRAQLPADFRQKIVNKLIDTLKKHSPLAGHDGTQQLEELAVRFEESIYTSATALSDYMRKISSKLISMQTRSEIPMSNAMQSNSCSQVMQQVNNQVPPIPIPGPSNLAQPGQHLLSQTMHNNLISTELQATGNSSIETGDWKAQLQTEKRKRIVNKMADTLKRHPLFSGHEGLQELEKIAEKFEEKIYTSATSQSDYMRKISIKMLTMQARSQNPMQSNSGANSVNPSKGVSG